MDLHRLPPAKFSQLLDAILQLNSCESISSFGGDGLKVVDDLISAEAMSLCWKADSKTEAQWLQGPRFPYSKNEAGSFRKQLADHPILQHYTSEELGRSVRLTDLMSVLDWRRHEIYRSCLQQHRLAYTLALKAESSDGAGLLLFIDRSLFDFSDEELLLLDALGPHLLQLLQRLSRPQPNASSNSKSTTAHTPKSLAKALAITPREAEILLHVAEGLSDKSIAERCKLHFTTVKKHLRNAYAKLNIPGRQAAILLVLEKTGKLR